MPYMSRLTALDGTVIEFVDKTARKNSVEYIKGTQNGPTNIWLGDSEDIELSDGKQIAYFLPFAGQSGPTLNITLANGMKTGPKDVLRNGLVAIDYGIPENSVLRLTWIEALDAWVAETKSGTDVISYNDLSDKPKIESVTLEGDKTLTQLGLQSITNQWIDELMALQY